MATAKTVALRNPQRKAVLAHIEEHGFLPGDPLRNSRARELRLSPLCGPRPVIIDGKIVRWLRTRVELWTRAQVDCIEADIQKRPLPRTTAQAAAACGITQSCFRSHAKRLGLAPCSVEKVWQGTRFWWSAELVRSIQESAKSTRRQPARQPGFEALERARMAKTRWFRAMYPNWRHAVLEACNAMRQLNRLARRSKKQARREEIYECKDDFVEYLHEMGFCTSVERHVKESPRQECNLCDGCGDDGFGGDGTCPQCTGTGIRRLAMTREYVCFYFRVEGEDFSWHRPAENLAWLPNAAVAEVRPMPTIEHINSTLLNPRQVDRALSLVRYVIEECAEPDGTPLLSACGAGADVEP